MRGFVLSSRYVLALSQDYHWLINSKAVQRAAAADPELIATNTQEEIYRESAEDRALNRQLAADSIVLLKNSRDVLPLDRAKIRKIAVVGPNAKTRTVSGGGSAYLTSKYVVTPLEGIQRLFEGKAEVVYSAGCYGTS
jgi:beta-glucosidase